MLPSALRKILTATGFAAALSAGAANAQTATFPISFDLSGPDSCAAEENCALQLQAAYTGIPTAARGPYTLTLSAADPVSAVPVAGLSINATPFPCLIDMDSEDTPASCLTVWAFAGGQSHEAQLDFGLDAIALPAVSLCGSLHDASGRQVAGACHDVTIEQPAVQVASADAVECVCPGDLEPTQLASDEPRSAAETLAALNATLARVEAAAETANSAPATDTIVAAPAEEAAAAPEPMIYPDFGLQPAAGGFNALLAKYTLPEAVVAPAVPADEHAEASAAPRELLNDFRLALEYAEDCAGKEICHVRVRFTNAGDEPYRGIITLNIGDFGDGVSFSGYAMPNGFLCQRDGDAAVCLTGKSFRANKAREFFVRVANETPATPPALCASLRNDGVVTLEEMKLIQTALAGRGLYDGRANGKFNRTTSNAITAFQTNEGIGTAGRPGLELLNALTGSDLTAWTDADSGNNRACIGGDTPATS